MNSVILAGGYGTQISEELWKNNQAEWKIW